jgi:hypothetical protein
MPWLDTSLRLAIGPIGSFAMPLDEAIGAAYREHGYTMKAIADYLGVRSSCHYQDALDRQLSPRSGLSLNFWM